MPHETLTLGDDLDQRNGEEYGHRIVSAGFHFQRGAHLIADMDAANAQQEEHGRRIRGGDDGAEQQALQPGKPQQQGSGPCKEHGCEDDADGCERDGGCRRKPEGLQGRAEAGIEKDDGKYERAEHIGERIIGEFDAKAIHTRRKADNKEEQQQRRAEAEGDEAGKGRDENQNSCDQQQKIK